MRFQKHELCMQAGQGAHTPVYLARGPEGGALVAVKLVPAGATPALVQALRARFARECEHAQVLGEYREVVRAMDHGTAAGIPYLMMEGVQGTTIDQLLGKPGGDDPLNPVRPSPMPAQRTVRMLRRIIAAVGRMHQHKLIHRDLKPSNLFVARSDQGLVKLSDTGVAWLASSADQPDHLVASPEALSPASAPYLAPELVRGDRVIRPCVDIYSIGVLAHEMVTGRLPYQVTEALVRGPNPEGAPDLSADRWGPFAAGWLRAHLMAERVAGVEARPDLPASLGDFLAQCLARDPRDRMQSTGELIMQLALIEQELARGGASAVSVPAQAVEPVNIGAPRPGAVSPVPLTGRPVIPPGSKIAAPGQVAARPPSGSLSKVINMAQDRDRLTMEVNQLRAALQETQTELTRVKERLAAVQAENRQLKQQGGGGGNKDGLRKTGRLPTVDSPGGLGPMGPVVPGPQASNPFMKTQLEGGLAEELERAAAEGEAFVEPTSSRSRPATGPRRPIDFKGTGPVQPRQPASSSRSLLQTRFKETVPGAAQRPLPGPAREGERPGDMVDRLIRETSASSASVARKLERPKRTGPQPAHPEADLDLMKTNILEGPVDEVRTAEPTSVVSEDDLMSEMKTRAMERAVIPTDEKKTLRKMKAPKKR